MSLYGGIKFSIPGAADQEDPAANAKPKSAQESETSKSQAVPAPTAPPPSAVAPVASSSKPAGEWSAALKFAPRINKPKPTQTRPAAPPSATSSTFSAEPTAASSAGGSGTSSPATIPASASGPGVSAYQGDIVRSAEPQLFINSQAQVNKDEVVLGPDGKPLARAPAMTLSSGKKGKGKGKGYRQDGSQAEGRKRRKKKKKTQPVLHTFDPDEPYDPYRPNDLGEYQHYRNRLREERRAKLIEEKRRKAAGESSGEGSSYYTDSSEEAAPRRDAPKLFAPPKQYSPPPSIRPPSPPQAMFSAPPPPTASAERGDDAYARRAAMAQASSGDDAYARRAALANAPASTTASTGDDAYARRAAMAQQPPPPPPHSFAPPSMTQPPPPPPPSDIPGFGSFSTPPPPPTLPVQNPSVMPPFPPSAPPSFAPPTVTNIGNGAPAENSGSGGPGSAEFAQMLEERKRAAAAIAAKLQGLSGSGPKAVNTSAPPAPAASIDDQGGTFAEKMFRKWGHKEGEGLGARGEGIVHALSAEHVEAPPKPNDPNQPLSKRQLAKQKAAAANAKNKNRKWVQHATSRGKIVNANEDERAKGEKERLGEASRIVCLVGVVESIDDVDEELSDEIGEECSKYGIVERVVLHVVEPSPEDPSECLRIFVVFSGMAGAWRAIKELDGRFFGGKKIRATYFDESNFDSGDRDGPLR